MIEVSESLDFKFGILLIFSFKSLHTVVVSFNIFLPHSYYYFVGILFIPFHCQNFLSDIIILQLSLSALNSSLM